MEAGGGEFGGEDALAERADGTADEDVHEASRSEVEIDAAEGEAEAEAASVLGSGFEAARSGAGGQS
ncbi:hypothetical protein ADK38_22725 [Streptomyces varsoviensis]|uniref:Uncharacterized protein n=1 Tax=Streptomyces varsoviensis TaxID=67373 RepID=A0ABR5J3C9_9ACTN|nr:hypothetical protein ADK38_22725 [Streptomyces varsoviensis]